VARDGTPSNEGWHICHALSVVAHPLGRHVPLGDDMGFRRVRTAAAIVCVVAAIIVGVPGIASASAPNPAYTWEPVVFETLYGEDWATSSLSTDFAVGDCVQEASSYVALHRPDVNGSTRVEWGIHDMYTTHTNNFDQWHATFYFETIYNTTVLTVGPVDAARMYHAHQPLGDVYTYYLTFDPRLFQFIHHVEWKGEC
jgi:hypothetical protein